VGNDSLVKHAWMDGRTKEEYFKNAFYFTYFFWIKMMMMIFIKCLFSKTKKKLFVRTTLSQNLETIENFPDAKTGNHLKTHEEFKGGRAAFFHLCLPCACVCVCVRASCKRQTRPTDPRAAQKSFFFLRTSG
jgi:hypothetical protein